MKIERNISIPVGKIRQDILDVITQMKKGDSVLVRDRDESVKFRNAMQNRGIRYISRKQEDGTFRIWHNGSLSGDPPFSGTKEEK